MSTVSQVLRTKPNEFWSIGPQASVFEALEIMANKNIGALLVLEGDKMVGIFSERDYARKVILKGRSSKTTKVGELMTSKVFYVHPDQSLEDCMALMTEHHIRHLPVMEDEKLLGIISIGDVVKAIISAQQFTIQQLEHYITGSGYA